MKAQLESSYFEACARKRVLGLVDAGTFDEIFPPSKHLLSPHLESLDLPGAFDDGVVIGRGSLEGQPVFVAAQEGKFMGGSVGEIHGAKITGLLELAKVERPAGVLLLIDSGGVRLQEANAGLIAISEIMRAVLDLRHAGIPTIAIIGGSNGCFGGMSIVARCCDAIVMSEEGRLGLSGPEVIETVHGVEEFDSRDRALVWRTVGGKHRYLLGEIDRIVDDNFASFRDAAGELMQMPQVPSIHALEAEHEQLAKRLERFGACPDAFDIWREMGLQDPKQIPLLNAAEFVAMAAQAMERKS